MKDLQKDFFQCSRQQLCNNLCGDVDGDNDDDDDDDDDDVDDITGNEATFIDSEIPTTNKSKSPRNVDG